MHQLFDEPDEPEKPEEKPDEQHDDIAEQAYQAFTFYLSNPPAPSAWNSTWSAPSWYSAAWDGMFQKAMSNVRAEMAAKEAKTRLEKEQQEHLEEPPLTEEDLGEILEDLQAVGALVVMRRAREDYGAWRDDTGPLSEAEYRRLEYQRYVRGLH